MSILSHVVVANQALHEDTKVRGPGVEARLNTGVVCNTGMMMSAVLIVLFVSSYFVKSTLA